MITIKYVGSKQRIAKDIAPIIQQCIKDNDITEYIEPFVGGANMIEHIKCDTKLGIDSNKYLIEFLKKIRDGWNPLETVDMSKEFYVEVKDNIEKHPPWIVGLVGFCSTYNAKWFGGYAGIVKTKINTYRNYYDEAVRNVLSQKENLQDTQLLVDDYKNISAKSRVMIYCDPPYENTTKYKDKFDHKSYWEWVRAISKDNYVLVSEYNAPADFQCVWEKKLTTTLDKSSRSTSTEKLFTYMNGLYHATQMNQKTA